MNENAGYSHELLATRIGSGDIRCPYFGPLSPKLAFREPQVKGDYYIKEKPQSFPRPAQSSQIVQMCNPYIAVA